MKRTGMLYVLLFVFCAVPSWGASLPAAVSASWVEQNLTDPDLRIIDIRKPEEYKAGHIAGAVNAFYGSWAITRKHLENQVPDSEDLLDVIRNAGIGEQSRVVVVGKVDTIPDQVNAPRVAWTLKFAGIRQAAFLDGGMNRWVAEKKPLSTDIVRVTPTELPLNLQKGKLALRSDVSSGSALVVDTRLPEFFFGASKVPHVKRAGRIPNSVNLPSPWIFNKNGTMRDVKELEAIAAGAVGSDKSREMILYCDSGRLSAGWSYVLAEILGYKKIRMYDDSLQDWVEDPNAPMVVYRWN